jgi:sarcosine oxidase, subunit alpha
MARAAGLPIESSTTILTTTGRLRVSGVRTGHAHSDGSVTPGIRMDCDLVLMSAGRTPSVHLFSQSRGTVAWSEDA